MAGSRRCAERNFKFRQEARHRTASNRSVRLRTAAAGDDYGFASRAIDDCRQSGTKQFSNESAKTVMVPNKLITANLETVIATRSLPGITIWNRLEGRPRA